MNSLKKNWEAVELKMDNDVKSALNLLGLARRAGKISLGFDSAEESVVKKKSKLIITAADISERTFSAFAKKAESNNINIIASDIPMTELGAAVGKLVGVVSVNDEGFAKKLQQLLA